MGWTIGIPSLKLNNVGTKSKHCGNFESVAKEALSERKGHDPDINPELSSKNRYEGFTNAAELIAYSDSHCSTIRDARGRALRKDCVRMCVTIIKPPAAYMATLIEKEQQQFLQDGIDKLTEIIGASNVKSIAWHYDEQGAHVHIFWEPITKDGRLCAKEMHNLTFLGRLNREIPIYLRGKGWDIDDCNAYDAAERVLESEKEKTERRHKNGRSSAVYKVSAEQELRATQHAANTLQSALEENAQLLLERSIEEVVSDPSSVYEDALFLLYSCTDERFEQLSREGASLKKSALERSLSHALGNMRLDDLVLDASKRNTSLSWQERQEQWGIYRELSNEFWELRNEINEEYYAAMNEAYRKKRNTVRSYYDAKYFLHRTRGVLPALIALIWALIAINQQFKYDDQIRAIQKERDELIRNTANFKKYSNAYREQLKAGKMPFEGCLSSMADLIDSLGKKEQQFRKACQERNSPSKIKKLEYREI